MKCLRGERESELGLAIVLVEKCTYEKERAWQGGARRFPHG
jgi:hypothetical protein